ncbi:30S ribosomal protein S17 [Maioricimonas rarisocia]|uniref:Small ribosomal subunit protein uS17 n=1 Tax=Maioricimonas rarisocia TaxID=2528026 RepID=A0A517ZBP8_9PLAN|nr:30S ribosomal protein S17 [Maioricimonas rarisocia]
MRKRLIGTVTSDKNSKTRRVEVKRLFQHPKYGKIVRGRTVCHVHDENNDSHQGDTVEIVESRPFSRLKRWELVRVVSAAADLRAAAAKEQELAADESEPEAAEGAAT